MTIFSPYCAILLSLSLALLVICILPTLINLFKNHHHHHHHHQNIHSFLDFPGGIGLIVAAIRHVIVKKPPSSPRKRDAGENVGLTSSCTESLGFESSDEIRTDDPITENRENKDSIVDEDYCCGRRTTAAEGGESENWRRKMRNHVKKEAKSFPPPLSSLNVKGQPSFFLRPVRKDGRLELTEVRIHRPEILHVWRHDGRLTLHLIPDETILDDDREQQEQEQEQEQEREIAELEQEIAELEEEIAESEGAVAEPEGEIAESEGEIAEETNQEEEEEEEEEENLEEEEEEVGFGDRSFGIGSNEGIRWCHEAVNHHHIRNVHLHHRHHHNHPLHVSGFGIA